MSAWMLRRFLALVLPLLAATVFLPAPVRSHCDTMNGPVVRAAQRALETGDVNLVLIWVQQRDEQAIREAFEKTRAVRKINPEVQKLADMYFFETLVRIHRAGEGAAYTGLKPAGTEVDAGIAAADEALAAGSLTELQKHLDEAIHHGLSEQYNEVMAKKSFAPGNVEAGREYVRAYVRYIHYVERLHQAAARPAAGHFHEATGMQGESGEE